MTRTREDDTGDVMAWTELFDDYTAILDWALSPLLTLSDEERQARIGEVWPTQSANGKDVLKQVLAHVKDKHKARLAAPRATTGDSA